MKDVRNILFTHFLESNLNSFGITTNRGMVKRNIPIKVRTLHIHPRSNQLPQVSLVLLRRFFADKLIDDNEFTEDLSRKKRLVSSLRGSTLEELQSLIISPEPSVCASNEKLDLLAIPRCIFQT